MSGKNPFLSFGFVSPFMTFIRASISKNLFLGANLDLNFTENLSLIDDISGTNLITFSRASTGTYVDSDGLIKTSPVNKLLYSNDFSNAAWIKSDVTSTSTNITAPDGTATATTFTFTQNEGYIYQNTSSVIGQPYVTSIWIKGNANATIGLRRPGISNSTIGDGSVAVNVTTEWQKFTAVTTSADTTDGRLLIDLRSSQGASVPSGFGVSLWHAQTEEGTTATDYIPTGATISGAPRFDHDPLNGESLGLLIEESRANLVTYSEDISTWSKSNVAVSSQSVSNPFGYSNVYRVRGSSSLNRPHSLGPSPSVSVPANTPHTTSVYVKGEGTGNDAGKIQIRIGGIGYRVGVINFDLFSNQSLTPQGLSGTSSTSDTWSINDYGMEPVDDGWYRIWMTHESNNTSSVDFLTISSLAAKDSTTLNRTFWYTASNTGGFYMVGAQVEQGSFPTSYIPTSGSAVTRAADVASITGTNFSSWFNPSEGTIYSKAIGSPQTTTTTNTGSGYPYIYSIDSSLSNRLIGSRSAGVNNGSWAAYAQPPASFSYVTSSNFNTQQVSHKVGGSYTSSTYVAFADGAVGSSITPGTNNSALLRLSIGSGVDGGFWGGHIARLAYFPTRKTDQELIKITGGTLDLPIITYGITSTGGVFNLRSTGTVDYAVDWDSTGGYESSTSNTLPHTYTAGDYDLVVYSNDVYRPYFDNVTADASQITSVNIRSGANLGTNLLAAWEGAVNMTSFVCPFSVTTGVTNFTETWARCGFTNFPLIDTSSGTSFAAAFYLCSNLTSFPPIDTSSCDNFNYGWFGCSSLTSFPLINTSSGTTFDSAWHSCNSLTSFPLIDTSSGTNLNRTWYDCNNLQGTFPAINTSSVTSFTWTWRFCRNLTGFPLIDTSSATNLDRTWESCTSLAGTFPLIVTSSVTNFNFTWNTCSSLTGFQQIDTSSGTNFNSAWRSCGGLTAFPAIDTSSGTNFVECWQSCTGLSVFPPLNMSSGTNFFRTWRICTGLTSFPSIDVSSGTNFNAAWQGASSLNAFPANMFDTTGTLVTTAFRDTWFNCALTAQSIENILVSLDTNGATGITLGINGGTNAAKTTWSAAAVTAYDNLIVKGWTISFNA